MDHTDRARRIVDLVCWPVDVPLVEEFTIAQGTVSCARNVFVRLTLADGTTGYGECAPFPDITGEDQTGTLTAIEALRELVVGESVQVFRRLSRHLAESAPRNPAARCGIETAILDAFSRAGGMPLWALLGGAVTDPQETDITIPILGEARALTLASHWNGRGFRRLKMKVGRDLDSDLRTITAIARKLPDVDFVIDANQGFDESDALTLIGGLRRAGIAVHLIEQPVHKFDLEAMARLRRQSPYPIGADESVATSADAVAIFRAQAADVINVKIMKSGVIEALDIAQWALSSGLHVMFGGMMETRLAMGCSLALAAALGPVHTLDLDTPLLMVTDPLEGGFRYEGPRTHLSPYPGLDVKPRRGHDYVH